MTTRILQLDKPTERFSLFVPQQLLNGMWQEFFGFDSNSPYLHVRGFDTIEQARLFLKSPSIWKEGTNPSGFVGVVVA